MRREQPDTQSRGTIQREPASDARSGCFRWLRDRKAWRKLLVAAWGWEQGLWLSLWLGRERRPACSKSGKLPATETQQVGALYPGLLARDERCLAWPVLDFGLRLRGRWGPREACRVALVASGLIPADDRMLLCPACRQAGMRCAIPAVPPRRGPRSARRPRTGPWGAHILGREVQEQEQQGHINLQVGVPTRSAT